MNSKLLALVLIAPLCGGMALAQTSSGTTDGSATASEDFGSDWSRTLGSAIFTDPEMTQMRTGSEISSQWATMSAEDKAMLKRDCAVHDTRTGATGSATTDQSTGTSTGTDSTASTGTTASGSASTGTGTDTSTTGTTGDGTMSTIRVNAMQMTQICDAIKTLN